MSSNRFHHASIGIVIATSLLASGAVTAAEEEELEEVTVTGSRVITDNVKSPTPISTLEVAEAAMTTPSDIADALNKLPQILAGNGGAGGGQTPRYQGNGATNNGGNTLSLRDFG